MTSHSLPLARLSILATVPPSSLREELSTKSNTSSFPIQMSAIFCRQVTKTFTPIKHLRSLYKPKSRLALRER
ncbi:hypothetical protein BT69DRAFT_941750 [Atractiella rhizophila]|nr:hypothetical protein BT69DRAFT_941750 [Atractiella rhizophila]